MYYGQTKRKEGMINLFVVDKTLRAACTKGKVWNRG